MTDNSIAAAATSPAPAVQTAISARADLFAMIDGQKGFSALLQQFDAALFTPAPEVKAKSERPAPKADDKSRSDELPSSKRDDVSAAESDDKDKNHAEIAAPRSKQDNKNKGISKEHKHAQHSQHQKSDAAALKSPDQKTEAVETVSAPAATGEAAVDDAAPKSTQDAVRSDAEAAIVAAVAPAPVQHVTPIKTVSGKDGDHAKRLSAVEAAAAAVADGVQKDAAADASVAADAALEAKNQAKTVVDGIQKDAVADSSFAAKAAVEASVDAHPQTPKPKPLSVSQEINTDKAEAAPRVDHASASPAAVKTPDLGFLAASAPKPTVNPVGAANRGGVEGVAAHISRIGAGSPMPEGAKPLLGYDATAQLASSKGAKSSTVARTQVMEQVTVKLYQQAKGNLDQMTIHLRPADLGRVDIKLDFHDGVVKGLITADSQATLDMLAKDSRSLERALQEAGLRADSGSLSFQLRDPGNGSSWGGDKGSKASRGTAELAAVLDQSADIATEDDVYLIEPGRVNLRV
ncbi:MAG: flagellar hook-length control protein FliK [Alphaproteobacteria bacterium]